MPIYEYTCENCGKDFEKLVSSSAAKPLCPECGSKKVQRRFSTFAAHGGGAAGKCPSASSCPMSEQPGCCGCGCHGGH
ncbi:MAG TPA: zinc ribbon domain-containing protein [Phycisphaerae bacterium]|nr:zinc ribbon domain-containing protein [Phycisphaerae bacterium]HPS53428.1 zinc ribbon domain-containing protein [Phycisphaerae bacterium]